MKSRTYDASLMQYMGFFESITKTKLKDCLIIEGLLVFIVEHGEIARAIGKKGQTVQKLQKLIKKRVKLVEFADDAITFIKNLITPFIAKTITADNGVVTINSADARTKNMLIGRNASNIKNYTLIVQRFFPIKAIKIQ